MDKEAKIQSILKAVESEIRAWVDLEPTIKDPILYERKLLELSYKFGKTLIVKPEGQIKDRNQKKNSNLFWES